MQKKVSILFTLLAILLAAGSVWYEQHPTAPAQATWEEVLQEADAGGYQLISTEELADQYSEDASSLLLIDTRQEWEYRTGHMKAALNYPMEPTWWSRWRKAGDLEEFLGTDKDRFLVFY